MKYRDLIKQTVKELVETKTTKVSVATKLDKLLGADIENNEKNTVINVIERELVSLHEGNIARFKLKLSDFQSWKDIWAVSE